MVPAPYFADELSAIYHGDCLTVMPCWAAEQFDAVLMDPPYGVNYQGRYDRKSSPIVGDSGDFRWLAPTFAECYRLLKPDTFAVSFYGWPHVERFVSAMKAARFRLVSHLAFVKNVWGFVGFTRGQHETAFLLAKGRPPKPPRNLSDVLHWKRERQRVHPNQKPVAALTPLLSSFVPTDGLVLDPFMGSASTLCAARGLSLPAVGIEVDEQYCAAGSARLTQGALLD